MIRRRFPAPDRARDTVDPTRFLTVFRFPHHLPGRGQSLVLLALFPRPPDSARAQ
jgi:hypothetical protein